MDPTADGLVSRVARELGSKADELIAEVERCLRTELPDLWEHSDAMTSENVARHVVVVLSALEHGVDPRALEQPIAELTRVRRLARHGVPVSVVLRAFRLGQGVMLDRLLEAMARLTDDATLISEAARRLIVMATGYVDRSSEQGVVAYEEERERRLRGRLSLVNEASVRIGTTLDIARTTQELADFATQPLAGLADRSFADLVTVDLIDSALHGHDAPPEDPLVLRRLARRTSAAPEDQSESGNSGAVADFSSGAEFTAGAEFGRGAVVEQGAVVAQGAAVEQGAVVDSATKVALPKSHIFLAGSLPARALATGQPFRHRLDGEPPDLIHPARPVPRGSSVPSAPSAPSPPSAHSMLVVPLRARGATLGVAQFFRGPGSDPFDDEDLLLAQEIAARAAVAVDNARRYTHARATAISLQRSLLPSRTPPQSAVEVACRYRPAGDRAGVGGDWYDVIPLSGARVALVVGDVVGHGIHAAATMGRLRTAVRTLADIDLPPDELLTHLDDVVLRLSGEAEGEEELEGEQEEGEGNGRGQEQTRQGEAGDADAGPGDTGDAPSPGGGGPTEGAGARAAAGHGLRTASHPTAGPGSSGSGGGRAGESALPVTSGAESPGPAAAFPYASGSPSPHPTSTTSPSPAPVGAESVGVIGATCVYAVYDPVSRSCTLARAGHVLPVLVTPDGVVDVLDLPPGPPLGLGGLPFEAVEFEWPEGTVLALYTDGLLEARGHDIDEGLARLREVLVRPAASLESTCDAVLGSLLPARPPDDVALLLARTRALGEEQVADWDLEADPAAVGRARANVARQLAVWGLEELDFLAELVVSELVTNAIRYGRPPIRLRLIHDRTLLCEVSDAGSTTPHLRRARVFDEGGRGLLLVAQLAERWGTRHARHGKTVWAELNASTALSDVAFL
ncbi:ATP-binding SpoIIE family protein phosphatase [Streptomyces neyagawaensis]|uniref:ATP-binding SpoIIE family protein phosphatase n=2 Tax=Streptomyces neyagawaensis TaxID=42238 RepID=UPI00201CCD11|nr:SpoIIE family protein phosphatase [Streptomyces neyagawaensis]MCL6738306.1 SpoIIE family protein phosphatase [Streptomyces neyagawaensis]MDE1688735.1 SpoIIE family protein phosphatase [Streptomyces neyagawaensis]